MPSQRVLISALLAAVASAADSSGYAPTTTTCPSGGALVRSGNSQLSNAETAYVAGRKAVADAALSTWLDSVSPGLGSSNANLPTIGMSVSGGGWRSLLTAGGILQALDGREDEEEGGLEERGLLSSLVSGLLQAVSYQVGVSGGAWLLASWASSNFATISGISESTWVKALDNGVARPDGFGFLSAYAEIAEQVNAKSDAGYPISMTDVWSQLLSYQFFPSGEASQSLSLSDVTSYSNMTDFQAPIIIINANGVNAAAGECNSDLSSTVWEFTPFEFGSWDDDVAAWIPVEYLGTSVNSTECTVEFDNMGFVISASSNLLAHAMCVEDDSEAEEDDSFMSGVSGVIETIVESTLHGISEATQFNRVPNPFQGYTSGDGSTTMRQEVYDSDELYMVDGGLAHNDPVASLLEPARNVSVILLSDASADSEDNFPTGEGLIDAWELVQNNTRINYRMPAIPDQETFLVQGLNRRAVFFGCNEPEAVTIVYLPNTNYTYGSNMPTSKYKYDPEETRGMIANGNAVATQNGDAGWGLCLACGIMKKEAGATLPEGCDACFSQYCY